MKKNTQKKFNCDSCEETFASEETLRNHDNLDHRMEFNCEQCDHQATDKVLLDNHIKRTNEMSSMVCKGVGNKSFGINLNTHNELMDHRRDHHNSGNKICRYFKKGSCFYQDGEEGECWYLHTQSKIQKSTETGEHFSCSFCENSFKTKSEVMKHRIKQHEEEVPICNSIKEGTRCSKNIRCWFRHPKPLMHVNESNVPAQNVRNKKQPPTISTSQQDFWKDLPNLEPPNQMQQLMEMLKLVISEVSQMKKRLIIKNAILE